MCSVYHKHPVSSNVQKIFLLKKCVYSQFLFCKTEDKMQNTRKRYKSKEQ